MSISNNDSPVHIFQIDSRFGIYSPGSNDTNLYSCSIQVDPFPNLERGEIDNQESYFPTFISLVRSTSTPAGTTLLNDNPFTISLSCRPDVNFPAETRVIVSAFANTPFNRSTILTLALWIPSVKTYKSPQALESALTTRIQRDQMS